jgi:hypothetical protein
VEHFARDTTDVAEIQEEEVRVRARAERRAQERAILLTSARGEADKAAQKVILLKGELAVAHQARDTAEVKLPGLTDKAIDADR